MIPLTRENLEGDIRRRVVGLQEIMRSKDLSVVIMPVAGAARMNGLLRYFTNAELWAGKAYVLAAAGEEVPYVLYASNYEAAWGEATATRAEIETVATDRDPMERLCARVRDFAGASTRIGIANADTHLSVAEGLALRDGLEGFSMIDVTDAINAMRLIKSPFEVEAMRDLGRIMGEAMDIYEENLRPGVRAWEVGAMAEAHIKASGGFRGWHKHSLDGRPFSMPTPLDRRLGRDDIITFELDYSGPHGYWCELSCVFSFGDLPEDARRRLELTQRAIVESAAAAVPGARKGVVGEVSDAIFREAGFEVIGAHTRHCHSIGTDDLDLRVPLPDDAVLEENMVLSYHPATLLEGDLAFLISDNFVITPGGAEPLSPRGWPHRIIG